MPELPTKTEIIRFRKLQLQKSAVERRLRVLEKEYKPLKGKLEAAIAEHGGPEREIAVGRFRVRARDGNRAPKWSEVFAFHCGAAKAKEIAEAAPPYILLDVRTV